MDKEPRIPIIHDFVEAGIAHFNEVVKQYDQQIRPDTEQLNRVFRSTLREVWGIDI